MSTPAPHKAQQVSTPEKAPSSSGQGASSSAAAGIPDVQILHEFKNASPWSTFYRIAYRVRGAHGAWIDQEREFLDRGDAVALLPYCIETGTVLLTRQFRMPIYVKAPSEAMLVEVCGGILDDPDPAVTLRHEAVEEIGLELDGFEKVFEGYSTPGSVCEKVHYFLAPYTAASRVHQGGGNGHEGEDIEILEVSLEEALRMIRQGTILDIRSIALLLYLAAYPPAGWPAAEGGTSTERATTTVANRP